MPLTWNILVDHPSPSERVRTPRRGSMPLMSSSRSSWGNAHVQNAQFECKPPTLVKRRLPQPKNVVLLSLIEAANSTEHSKATGDPSTSLAGSTVTPEDAPKQGDEEEKNTDDNGDEERASGAVPTRQPALSATSAEHRPINSIEEEDDANDQLQKPDGNRPPETTGILSAFSSCVSDAMFDSVTLPSATEIEESQSSSSSGDCLLAPARAMREQSSPSRSIDFRSGMSGHHGVRHYAKPPADVDMTGSPGRHWKMSSHSGLSALSRRSSI